MFKGWNSRHDEWITETQALERFTKHSKSAAEEAKVKFLLEYINIIIFSQF